MISKLSKRYDKIKKAGYSKDESNKFGYGGRSSQLEPKGNIVTPSRRAHKNY